MNCIYYVSIRASAVYYVSGLPQVLFFGKNLFLVVKVSFHQHMNVFVYHKDIAHVVTKATNATMAAQALAGMAGKRKVGGTCWEVAHLLQHGYTVETLLKNGGVHLVPPGSPTKEEHTSVLKSKGQ